MAHSLMRTGEWTVLRTGQLQFQRKSPLEGHKQKSSLSPSLLKINQLSLLLIFQSYKYRNLSLRCSASWLLYGKYFLNFLGIMNYEKDH